MRKNMKKNLVVLQICCNLCTRKNEIRHALLAQLVEQLTLNQWVQGSNP